MCKYQGRHTEAVYIIKWLQFLWTQLIAERITCVCVCVCVSECVSEW